MFRNMVYGQNNEYKDKYGTKCGASYTVGHYNPYAGPVCADVEQHTFYNCEVSDISDKFGGTPKLMYLVEFK